MFVGTLCVPQKTRVTMSLYLTRLTFAVGRQTSGQRGKAVRCDPPSESSPSEKGRPAFDECCRFGAGALL